MEKTISFKINDTFIRFNNFDRENELQIEVGEREDRVNQWIYLSENQIREIKNHLKNELEKLNN